ncbi:MAG: hypothetical protein KGI56_05860 [Acidobacteriota bacterium]|nr:hypothetical protein [Acidobacteriota bacterium]
MRSLATLGLLILSVLPLAARDHDHGPWRERGARRVVVLEARPGRYDRYDGYGRDDRWGRYGRYDRDDDRWEGRACRDVPRYRYRAYDDGVVVCPRPLAPPWRSRIVFRFRW